MQTLGDRIKAYRISIKMTQMDFAARLGITGSSVSAYENGTRLPSYEVLVKIADALGVTTDELLGRKKNDKVIIDVTDLTPRERNVIQEMINLLTEKEEKNPTIKATPVSTTVNTGYGLKKNKKSLKGSLE